MARMRASSGPPRRRAVTFRPRFTLMIAYVALFFVVLALLMILPELVGVIRDASDAPAGAQPSPEEMQSRASEVARRAMQGRVLPAFAVSVALVGVLAWARRLPGMR